MNSVKLYSQGSLLRTAWCRYYATAVKPDIKLLSKLRKETEVSMTKAKEALVKHNNDYEQALAWLAQDAQASGAKKAQKVAGRTAAEGLISIASVNVPSAAAGGFKSKSTIIELNCETDFVSRNDVFKHLASRIAATSLLLHEPSSVQKRPIENISVEDLLKAPLMPHPDQKDSADIGKSIEESIVEAIGKLGEKITLRRVAVVADGVSAGYVHGGDAVTGKMGGLAVLEPLKVTASELQASSGEALAKCARQVARQVVGFSPSYLHADDVPKDVLESQSDRDENLRSNVLNEMGYLLKPDQTVAEFVNQSAKDTGVEGAAVVDYVRWQVGEGIEKRENDFADEVARTVRGN
ncbi:elongation factor TS-domain-containing protein [Radiomyces spectabilis]|uniref:elongation factor TS-domain-containing protein n=1 Tax=Radiomyces spectabilis TaxID=64574 RepID=UPI0022202EFB|nr:elongation factor TS-domain-containing protein [Radiomyces spectabilis]KAI8377643.1 elongation factor TS-domain-containing protein [Radiomyces spectabilis]